MRAAVSFWLLAVAAAAAAQTSPQVRVKQGLLRGVVRGMKLSNKKMLAFLGIPYAKPPLGPLRFKDPVPAKPWEGERLAFNECSECTQPVDAFGPIGLFTKGSEDCLCLNVYTPNPKPSKASVMVWIHGGAFVAGSGDRLMYGPDFIVPEGVVLVSVNYRLGSLGFLNLDHEEAPGNQALKDQSMALQWVHDNIEAFGGNPNNVTIFGESAGSASVHFQTLSPMSKGLFSAAIMQSGNALNPWAFKRSGRGNAARLLASVGCDEALVNDAPAAVECLRRQPASALVGATTAHLSPEDKEEWREISFTPTLDGKFLPDEPCRLEMEQRVTPIINVLAGFNSAEGIVAIPTVRFGGGVKHVAADLANGKGLCFPCSPRQSRETLKKWASQVEGRYFDGKPFSENTMQGYVNYASYFMFIRESVISALARVRNSTSAQYVYEFDVDASMNGAKIMFGGMGLSGASHADELGYLFYNKLILLNSQKNSVEDLTRRRLTKMWTNFAKTGNPTPQTNDVIPVTWEQFNAENEPYLYIGNKGLEMKQHPLKEDRVFFEQLTK